MRMRFKNMKQAIRHLQKLEKIGISTDSLELVPIADKQFKVLLIGNIGRSLSNNLSVKNLDK